LKIPLARDNNGRIVSPESASKSGDYFCPSCGEVLVFKKGKIKKPHFSHKATDQCSQETVVHQTAKSLLVQSIQDWKSGFIDSPKVKRLCEDCGVVTIQGFPDKVVEAVDEKRLENGYIVDIALTDGEKVLAAIEIKVTHGVDQEKKNKLGIPFIEVHGDDVLKTPAELTPLIDQFKPFRCRYCQGALRLYESKMSEISRKTKVEIPDEFYRPTCGSCWRCGREILIFAWPTQGMHNSRVPEHIPRPKTIQYRYSRQARSKYWVNTCPYCNNIQGDFFLFSDSHSPLFGFHCSGPAPDDYEKDIKHLAIRYRSEVLSGG
jgi:RNase P subunit RPR2